MTEEEWTTIRIKRSTVKKLTDRCSYGEKPCDKIEELLDNAV